MRIIVVGCGKIGVTVISSLLDEGHDIIAIDNDPEVISNITNVYDVMGVCGNASDYDTLREAEIEKAELFAAITGSDEVNMLSCFIAKKMGAKHTIARIRNPEYNDSSLGFLKQTLGLSMSVNPDMLAAQEILHILKMPAAVNIETFSRRNFEMIEFNLPENSPLEGLKLIDMKKKYPYKYLICAVMRNDEVYIPDGNFVLQTGDRIGITADFAEMQKLFRELGMLSRQSKNVMIVGASRVGFYLTKTLLAGGSNVKVIEQNRERGELLLEKNPKAVVICGDATDRDLLTEEGISGVDAFVSLTGMDEQNMLLSYAANITGVPKVVTKISRQQTVFIPKKMGLETIICPQNIMADIFVRYARALENSLGSKIETMYKLMDGKSEALEFIAQQDFKHFGIKLKDLTLKPDLLIAGIIRGRKVVIPTGEDEIMQGDRVIVITTETRMNDLSDIIR